MKDESKYIDPARNPMIKIQQDDIPPLGDEEPFVVEDFRIPLPKDGLFPGEAKPEKKAAEPSVETIEKVALEGINDDTLKELMGSVDIYYIYDTAFYDEATSEDKKIYMQPVLSLTKRGSEVAVNRMAGGQNILTKGEADLIHSLMKREKE